jgi:hypothetical protein
MCEGEGNKKNLKNLQITKYRTRMRIRTQLRDELGNAGDVEVGKSCLWLHYRSTSRGRTFPSSPLAFHPGPQNSRQHSKSPFWPGKQKGKIIMLADKSRRGGKLAKDGFEFVFTCQQADSLAS